MRKQAPLRGFLIGVLVGVLAGSAGMAVAAFGYKGWTRFSDDFKTGYITGFIDMSNLARNLDPGGYLDVRYPVVQKAKPMEWRLMVDELYRDPKNQDYTITSMLQLAAHKLQDKYGPGLTPEQRSIQRMQKQLEAVKRRREAAGLPPVAEKPKTLEATPKVEANKRPVEDPTPKRKWCRCDGKIPKEERQRRRAAAAAEEGKDGAAPDAGEAKPAAK